MRRSEEDLVPAARAGIPTFALPKGIAVALALLLLTGSCYSSVPPTPAPISITVDGASHLVSPGTTLGGLEHELQLSAPSGRLVSVRRQVLVANAFPGAILLDGYAVSYSTILRAGEHITVVGGRDRTEPTVSTTRTLRGRHPGDPEYTLRRYRIEESRVLGKLSGELRSVVFDPRGRPRSPPEVALSFDDGPWPGQTQQVLAILRRFHVKATFFMIGEQVLRYPGIVREIARAGMTIGNHSWDHPTNPPLASLSPGRILKEISKTDAALAHLGVHPFVFRPPGGSTDGVVVTLAEQAGLRVVDWSIDPKDWLGSPTRRQLVRRVLAHVRPGSIVLMHDGGGDRSATIAALPQIIRGIRKKGLRLVTIPKT